MALQPPPRIHPLKVNQHRPMQIGQRSLDDGVTDRHSIDYAEEAEEVEERTKVVSPPPTYLPNIF